ncbi:MAG: hypothetical protein IT299_04900 [Dehalococcoidia bacterium]|nr:hypothetical protein [Dehalococcoidia bacterium]
MQYARTMDDLARELARVTSAADAQALINRAARRLGVAPERPLDLSEMLIVCHALAEEGGTIQAIAEQVAATSIERLGPTLPADAD